MAQQPLDPRINPYRNDLAAEYLRGKVSASAFISGRDFQAVKGIVPLYKNPLPNAEQISQMRYGDTFTVYEDKQSWMWGQCLRDGYVGYVKADSLSKNIFKPTHFVSNLATIVFAEPRVQANCLDRLTFFSGVEVVGEAVDGGTAGGGGQHFYPIRTGGFVHKRHVTPVSEWHLSDYVGVAERMLDVPYEWGGITPTGLDCSGLVQLSLQAAGLKAPRDSDMQCDELGTLIAEKTDDVPLKRGDLVFIKGHVGMMADAVNLIHANAFHGRVFKEPLADVLGRYEGWVKIKRLI